MPLVPDKLSSSLENAFEEAMLAFADTISSSEEGTDVADDARKAAAKKFAELATAAIDSYIRSQTIVIPPGQTVTVATPAGPAAGASTAASPAAIIK